MKRSARALWDNRRGTIYEMLGDDVFLVKWNPGDGAHYHIEAKGGAVNLTPYMSNKEMCAFIDGILLVADGRVSK